MHKPQVQVTKEKRHVLSRKHNLMQGNRQVDFEEKYVEYSLKFFFSPRFFFFTKNGYRLRETNKVKQLLFQR